MIVLQHVPRWSRQLQVALLCGAACMPFAAHAQEEGDLREAPADVAAEGDRAASGGLEEIIVTAQKRSERLQDVPIAVTAVTSARLEAAGVASTMQLQEIIPGLVSAQKTLNSSPFLRGLGVGTSQAGFDASVATYVDDVYMSNPVSSSFNLNSIERVEVLRGPQGTLFGRNASAGVVSLYTLKPSTDEASMKADLSYGNFETVTARGYVNVPLSQSVAANISAYYNNQNDGWGRNVVRNEKYHTDRNLNLRGKLLFDLGADTEIVLTGWYVDFLSSLPNTTSFPGTVATGGFVCSTCSVYDGATNQKPQGQAQLYGGSARISHSLGSVDVVNITAYQVAKPSFQSDPDQGPMNVQFVEQEARQKTFTNETQLISTGSGPFRWTAGFFFLKEDVDFFQRVTGTATPAGSITESHLDTTSYAAFGQASYEVLTGTTLTAGLRYTIDERERQGRRGNLAGTTPAPDADATFKRLSWRFAVDQKFSPDIMGYASYSRGFKAGLLNVAEVTGPAINPEIVDSYEIGLKTQLFDRNLLVNVALFHYEADDLQLRALVPGTSIVVFTNAASARGRGVDVDFDAAVTPSFRITGGFEILDAKFVSFPSATFSTARPPAIGGNVTFLADASGRPLPYSAKFTGNVGGNYTVDLANGDEIRLGANVSYRTRYYFDPDPRLSQKGFALVNGSIGYATAGGALEISVWGRNLFNKQYASGGTVAYAYSSQYNPGAPRTYGATLGMKF